MMETLEWLDVLDENGVKIGVKEREAIHRDGDWHRTFDCWLVDVATPAVLFQQRSFGKRDFPGLFDTSAAGHYRAGETWLDGVRELEEEVGLTIPPHQLVPLGVRTKAVRQNDRVDNEFQDVFLAPAPRDPSRLRLNPAEVAGVAWIELTAGLAFFAEARPWVEAEWWGPDGRAEVRRLAWPDFVPAKDRYYLKVFIMVERWLGGRRELAI